MGETSKPPAKLFPPRRNTEHPAFLASALGSSVVRLLSSVRRRCNLMRHVSVVRNIRLLFRTSKQTVLGKSFFFWRRNRLYPLPPRCVVTSSFHYRHRIETSSYLGDEERNASGLKIEVLLWPHFRVSLPAADTAVRCCTSCNQTEREKRIAYVSSVRGLDTRSRTYIHTWVCNHDFDYHHAASNPFALSCKP